MTTNMTQVENSISNLFTKYMLTKTKNTIEYDFQAADRKCI